MKHLALSLILLSLCACGSTKYVRGKPQLYDDGNKVYSEIEHKPLSLISSCEEKRLKVKAIARTGIVTKEAAKASHYIRRGDCEGNK